MVDLDTIGDSLSGVGHGLGRALRRVFGSRNERAIRRIRPLVAQANAAADWAKGLSAEQMRAQTAEWREAVRAGRNTLAAILPQAFAMVREAAARTIGLRHFDVQLIGGAVLHQGDIAEMATGEGKTLVATLPAYLNALAGSVYVVTVNDYLARRDAEWMRPVYEYVGMQVGAIQSWMLPAHRKPVYACDIVYGTNNEFGFDYLRDNMKSRAEDQVQKRLDYAIVDEVDSILIDEARTPLIISGPAEEDAEKYRHGMAVARKLEDGAHFELKEKEKQALMNEDGIVRAQQLLGVDDFYTGAANMEWPHILEQCLRALHLYKLDVDYVVKDGDIIIVDEFTGRLMEGRRWSDGLHQAVEAKEGLTPKAQNQTLATITLQNYFRLFKKLSGMTGTAMTEAGEFAKIYDMDVVQIPTNRPVVRQDDPDVIYLHEKDKWKAIAEEIERVHKLGQPMLVGTTSIEKSELLSGMLNRRGVRHNVLNAKQHEREAEIVAQAGRKGAVTVATNMAGRGTDIVLGGNADGLLKFELARRNLDPANAEHQPEVERLRSELKTLCAGERGEVVAAGGLYVLGTERHEARRIDNQLRGRSGRQGDPGRSRFYLSLDDDLMRKFYKDWVKNFLARAGMGGGEPVESAMVSRAIEKAQKKVENYHFEIRRNLLDYDEVMDKQRKLIYQHRQEVLEGRELRPKAQAMFEQVLRETIKTYGGDGKDVPPDYDAIAKWAHRKWGYEGTPESLRELGRAELDAHLLADVRGRYDKRVAELGDATMGDLERFLLLNGMDNKWKDHLYTMDALRSGIGLRGYAQVDPKNEYKREGLERFEELLYLIADDVTNFVLRVQIRREDEQQLGRAYASQQAFHPSFGPQASATAAGAATASGMQPMPGAPGAPGSARPVQVAVGYQKPQQTPALNPLQQYAKQRAAQEAASLPQGAKSAPSTAPVLPAVGRNDPCPCGSGKKYKACHGKSA
ncbi:MAG: preprotein translocase subunit SecA [Planctomycetota bacterium]|nr:MAG: preprotein translocase subunit SecA [Planctomycetota bacterium]